jgi:hypothetical protein
MSIFFYDKKRQELILYPVFININLIDQTFHARSSLKNGKILNELEINDLSNFYI